MAKNWQEVKDAIEKDLDRIWWEEPEEVKMCRLGIYPSGAGTEGQILGNLVFLIADTQGMGWWGAEPSINSMLSDPDFTVDHCKKAWKYMVYAPAGLLGEEDPPNCPAPWFNLPKLWEFCKDVIASYDSIKTKEELADVIWSWENYVNRLNWWFFLIFPWEIGQLLPRIEQKNLEELARLSGLKVTK